MLKRKKRVLIVLCAALLLLIGALLIYGVFQENRRPSGTSRFVQTITEGRVWTSAKPWASKSM